ncbi:MAG TPA: cytochrome c maturation protein CcmE [Acidimicrobiales bacterium]|nr:cytochrome c maturation protein CcmE [Acidimicrobiales bacterium]
MTAGPAVEERDRAPVAPRHRRPRHRLRLVLVFVVLGAAVVFLLVEGLGSSLDYFDTVHQALTHRSSLGTSTFRLEGTVVAGTVHDTRRGTDFSISGGGDRVAVVNTGSPPQLFQATIPVVVVGHFASAGSDTFVSDQIMVKHSATYIAQHPARVRGRNGTVVRSG